MVSEISVDSHCLHTEGTGSSLKTTNLRANWSEKTFHKLSTKAAKKQTLRVTEKLIPHGAAMMELRPKIKLWGLNSPRLHNQTAKYFSSGCIPIGSTRLTCSWLIYCVFSLRECFYLDKNKGLTYWLNLGHILKTSKFEVNLKLFALSSNCP